MNAEGWTSENDWASPEKGSSRREAPAVYGRISRAKMSDGEAAWCASWFNILFAGELGFAFGGEGFAAFLVVVAAHARRKRLLGFAAQRVVVVDGGADGELGG